MTDDCGNTVSVTQGKATVNIKTLPDGKKCFSKITISGNAKGTIDVADADHGLDVVLKGRVTVAINGNNIGEIETNRAGDLVSVTYGVTISGDASATSSHAQGAVTVNGSNNAIDMKQSADGGQVHVNGDGNVIRKKGSSQLTVSGANNTIL